MTHNFLDTFIVLVPTEIMVTVGAVEVVVLMLMVVQFVVVVVMVTEWVVLDIITTVLVIMDTNIVSQKNPSQTVLNIPVRVSKDIKVGRRIETPGLATHQFIATVLVVIDITLTVVIITTILPRIVNLPTHTMLV